MPDGFRRLQGHLLKRPGGDREMVEILALVLQHDEQAVLCAVELALEDGVPTKTHILNILHRPINELHMVYPFAGSRMLRDLLGCEGVKVGRLHVATLMEKMVCPAICR
jgi:hypothetical protein